MAAQSSLNVNLSLGRLPLKRAVLIAGILIFLETRTVLSVQSAAQKSRIIG